MSFDARDELIDEYRAAAKDDIEFVFGQFLAGVSDDPRAIVFDILLLDMLDSGMQNVITSAPFQARSQGVLATVPELPEGRTAGLGQVQESVEQLMRQRVAAVVQLLVTKANEMAAGGLNRGFQDVAGELLSSQAGPLADAFNNALLLWERMVLDRVGDLMDEVLWVYAGPADEKNRPFCAEVVRDNKAYTRAGVEALNDHPLLDKYVPPNVFALCGGFNCRHVFLPITPDYAAAQGLDRAN